MKKLSIVKGIAGLAVMAAVFCGTAFSSLAAEGKITAETAKIRASASTDSEVVGSTVKGKTIDILEAVKDSSGTVWYKVSVANGGYGYIRSDLVQTSETIEVSTQTSSSSTQTQSQPAETVPTSIGEQQAVVKSGKNANVRSGASTQHSVVASLPAGTSVTLIGEANDSAGNKWYQLTCSYNGKTVEGYVRSDLLTIGAGEAPAETGAEGTEGGEGESQDPSQSENPEEAGAPEEGGEAPAPEEEHNDYQVVYTANSAGEMDYYLYLPGGENMVRVSELLNASEAAKESTQKLQDQLNKEKIVIIILAVVIVLLFIVITVLLFKIRSLYYEDYEDEEEEEEEEEEEPAPVRKKVRRRVAEEEEEPEPAPVKKKRPAPSDDYERPAKPREKSGQPKAREDKELHAAERKEPEKKPEKKPASRKPQNFLIDDDEFEFEFLNMDDKDL